MATLEELASSVRALITAAGGGDELTMEVQGMVNSAFGTIQAAIGALSPEEPFTPIIEQGIPLDSPPVDEPPQAPPA